MTRQVAAANGSILEAIPAAAGKLATASREAALDAAARESGALGSGVGVGAA